MHGGEKKENKAHTKTAPEFAVNNVKRILFDREVRSGLSMSFFLLLLQTFRQILILDKNSESLILDKKTGKSHLG